MPRRSPLVKDAYYHVFNRGVEKRQIFLDQVDYQSFAGIISFYLKKMSADGLKTLVNQSTHALSRTSNSQNGLFQGKLQLNCFILMPNHFHFLIYQEQKNVLSAFMQRLGTTYAQYFNQKYKRVGSLFQGRFKAKPIETDAYLLQASKYIHRNLLYTQPGSVIYPWSSYPLYLSQPHLNHPLFSSIVVDPIRNYFNKHYYNQGYQSFVEESPVPPHYRALIQF
jgi:putative transposase